MGPKNNTFLTPLPFFTTYLSPPPILSPILLAVLHSTKYFSNKISKPRTKRTYFQYYMTILTLFAPCISESCVKIKIDLNFYFTLLRDPSKGCVKKGSVKKKE